MVPPSIPQALCRETFPCACLLQLDRYIALSGTVKSTNVSRLRILCRNFERYHQKGNQKKNPKLLQCDGRDKKLSKKNKVSHTHKNKVGQTKKNEKKTGGAHKRRGELSQHRESKEMLSLL